MIVFVDNDDRDDVGLDEGIEVQKLMNQMQFLDRKAFFCGIFFCGTWHIFGEIVICASGDWWKVYLHTSD